MKSQGIIATTLGMLKFLKTLYMFSLKTFHLSGMHLLANQITVFAKSLLPIIFLSGCTIQYPVWLGHADISQMCEQSGIYNFTHHGDTKEFSVHLVDRIDIPKICGIAHDGNIAQACIINNFDIYVAPGRGCPNSMAHELSHGFGLHFVDRPIVRGGFNHG